MNYHTCIKSGTVVGRVYPCTCGRHYRLIRRYPWRKWLVINTEVSAADFGMGVEITNKGETVLFPYPRQKREDNVKRLYQILGVVSKLTYTILIFGIIFWNNILWWPFMLLSAYHVTGTILSLKGAPLSWKLLVDNADKNGTGNIPFFIFFWPWPVAAQCWKWAFGKYPTWTPDI